MLTKNLAVLEKTKTGCSVQVLRSGELLSDVAIAAGINLDLRCGGNGVCNRCEVEWAGERVVSCQTIAAQIGIMHIPANSLVAEEFAVETAFLPPVPRAAHPRCTRMSATVPDARNLPGLSDWARLCSVLFHNIAAPSVSPLVLRKLPHILEKSNAVRITLLDNAVIEIEEASAPRQPVLGVAVDVGTTTVVARLLDLSSGEQLAIAGGKNRQVGLGANVISRIALGSTERGLTVLKQMVTEKTLTPLIEDCLKQARLANESFDEKNTPVRLAVIGGNTVMTHLFLGLSPQGLGSMPFNAVTLTPDAIAGSELNLPVDRVECLPCSGAYIGGDIIGGIYALGLDRSGPAELLIDIGTNSEMVLRVGDKLYAASAPAGPAFEGGGLTCGGPASPGAVTHLTVGEKGFELETYQHATATHICGSAYVDFLSEGRAHGFLSEHGRFIREVAAAKNLLLIEKKNHLGQNTLFMALTEEVSICEQDIALLLQAKAAVLSGAQVLLDAGKIAPSELHALHVAGGFGRHLSAAHAIRCGLLPDVPAERIKVVGNTSLAACSGALLNQHAEKDMREIASRVHVIELNLEEGYEDCYISALLLPY